jgi:hypothetical protein
MSQNNIKLETILPVEERKTMVLIQPTGSNRLALLNN